MEVEVRLFAALREGRFVRRRQTLSDGATVGELLDLLELAPDDVGMVLVNGRDAPVGQVLQNGDVVASFPLVGGG